MSRELFITKNKHPKVSFEDYEINVSEPVDYSSHDSNREIEPKLLENSKLMRRRFRRLARSLTKRHPVRLGSLGSTPYGGYFAKFNKNERRRIMSQLAETRKADEFELSKQKTFITLRKQSINLKRQKQGLMPIL